MLNFFKGSKKEDQKNIRRLYVAHGFSVLSLKSVVESFFKEQADTNYTLNKSSNGFSVDYDIDKNEQKNILSSTRLQFSQNDTIVYVIAEEVTIDLTSYEEQNTAATFNLKKNPLFVFLQQHLLTLQDDQLFALANEEAIGFVQETDTETKNFIFHNLIPNEYVLSILGISELTFKNTEITVPKNTYWHFVLTSNRRMIIGVSEEKSLHIDISEQAFEITEKTGKDLVTTDTLTFYTEFFNDSSYRSLLPAIVNTTDRLNTFADILVKTYHKKDIHLSLASKLYTLEADNSKSTYYNLKSDLIPYLKRLKIDTEQELQLREVLTKHAIASETFGTDLINSVKDWNVPYEDQKNLLRIMISLQQEVTAKNTIAYHQYINELFKEKEKKDDVIFEFDLNYAKHLENATLYQEAITVYKSIYESLPDDSISDLLPTNTTNLLEGEGGQQLKITILESILRLQHLLHENHTETIHKLAGLQPLLLSRITALATHSNHQQKANEILSLLNTKNFVAKQHTVSEVQPLDKKSVVKEVFPSCFQNATGFFDSLNSFMAALNPPDYDAVISFSDILDHKNYPEITTRIHTMCQALQIDIPEYYIGRGAYASSVIGVEGKPSFLLIGHDFLNPENTRYLDTNSLCFLVAIELAHIYFKHSKITATDVWRGAAEKGFTMVNMLLTFLPFVGNIGTLFGNVTNIEKYTKILDKVETVANVAEKGQGILEWGEKFNILSKKKSQENDSQNLLITSRLMEIVADKVALLFCDDLASAVKAILANTGSYEKHMDVISNYGLQAFLARTNEEGAFVHQEISIRIKNLCSFYLSEEYIRLKMHLQSS